MKSIIVRHRKIVCLPLALMLAGCSAGTSNTSTATTTGTTTLTPANTLIASLQPYNDSTGTVSTYTSAGNIDTTAVFFQPLGTNGRTCASCHQPAQGMSISPTAIQALFASTAGADPLFAAVDGANCPTAAAGDSAARSLLLNSGLIRIGITVPTTAQFTITAISDPYGCAITVNSVTGAKTVSVYRRPLPTTGIQFFSNVMWDTRETIQPLTSATAFLTNLNADLTQQAIDAVATHAQGTVIPTAGETTALIAFMQGLATAQATDTVAGSLSANGAKGGATNLAAQNYYPGINDAFGQDPTGAKFNPNIFNLFAAWQGSTVAQQASIARGQGVFNTAPMLITNVRGINDDPALGSPPLFNGSCGTCHDTPNVGSHSLPLPLDTAVSRIAANETDPGTIAGTRPTCRRAKPADLTRSLGCTDVNGKLRLSTRRPTWAMLSSQWPLRGCEPEQGAESSRFRGAGAFLPQHQPAANLTQLVSFYNARFQMRLNPQQQADLVNFLNSL